MGEAKNRKQRFLADHPFCCFCGGSEAAVTVDHVPARTCFVGRAGPEGFEFPACTFCQRATRLDELAFGMFVRLIDPSDENYETAEVQKAYLGVKNNLPHLLPFFGLSNRDKRLALRTMGLEKPANMLTSDIPLVAIPVEIDVHVHRYARKIAAALYYREKHQPIKPHYHFWTDWCQATDKRRMAAFLEVARMSPFAMIGERQNLNFGNRFGYRYDMAPDNNLFTAIAQFGQGLVLVMLIADGVSDDDLADGDWVSAAEMFG